MVHVLLHEVADVGHHGNLGVNQGVLAAEAPDREPGGVERTFRAPRHAPGDAARRLLPQVRGHALRREQLPAPHCPPSADATAGNVDVVRMLVRDEDGVRTVQRFGGLGKRPGIQHQDPPVLFQPDAGMREFCQLHGASLGIRPRISVHRRSGW